MEDSSMTDTIQTPADTAADEATEAVQAEEFLYLDPADIIIGTNVRTDLRADHKEFRKSIKERGVLEAVTVYRNEEGQHVLLRGQRRTVTAAEVGTPTGLIPARVVPQPADADRIELPVAQEVQHVAAARALRVGRHRALALDAPEGKVEDGSEHELPGDREIPANTARRQDAVPLHRKPGLAGAGEARVIAAVGQGALEVQRHALADPAATADRGLPEIGVARALIRDRERAGGDIRHQRKAHQRKDRVSAFLQLGFADLRLRGAGGEQEDSAQRAQASHPGSKRAHGRFGIVELLQ